MTAKETSIAKLLSIPAQFIVPLYQRTYDWSEDQCDQFYADVRRIGEDQEAGAHFAGAIVHIGERGGAVVPQYLIIDGQQRMTTMSLLIAALASRYEAMGDTDLAIRTRRRYLINDNEAGEDRHKLLLTDRDRDTLVRLSNGNPLLLESSTRIVTNYNRFFERISDRDEARRIETGIRGIQVVEVALEQGRDNPQLIFESLNSTGLRLSQADLIRNFVLMGQDPKVQNRLYADQWRPMERLIVENHDARVFDSFVRDYLTWRNQGQIANERDIYAEFKRYAARSGSPPLPELVADLHTAARRYARFAFGQEADEALATAFGRLREIGVNVCYPLLLDLYDRYEGGTIDRDDFVAIVRHLESYVLRRTVCGLSNAPLNRIFAAAPAAIPMDDPEVAFEQFLARRPRRQRYPDDGEFTWHLMNDEIYNYRHRWTLFANLENWGRKEREPISGYTIEHILPQGETVPAAWREMLGEEWERIHRERKHTLGNLTLTGYNSEYSNRDFRTKRTTEKGFDESPLRLNADLRGLDRWDEDAIVSRGQRLARRACEIWPDLPRTRTPVPDSDAIVAALGSSEPLYQRLLDEVRSLAPQIELLPKQTYLGLGSENSWISVLPRASELTLVLNAPIGSLDDPLGKVRDLSKIGHHGTGDAEVRAKDFAELEEILPLVRQTILRHAGQSTERE